MVKKSAVAPPQTGPCPCFALPLAVSVCVVSSLLATISDWGYRGQPRTDFHKAASYDEVGAKVRAILPNIATMGYLTNGEPLHFYKFQYAVTPTLLIPTTTETIVLGYFPSTSPSEVMTTAN